MPFSSLPQSAFVETETEPRTSFGHDYAPFYSPLTQQTSYEPTSETGRNTFFWYRVYCGVTAAIYALIAALGLFVSYVMAPEMGPEATENLILGLVYTIFGTVGFAIFLVASTLPPKPYNWIVGIVMISIGMTSCCFWPAVIPLLIYWIKPETREFFGRK
jgi:hypothetical protein